MPKSIATTHGKHPEDRRGLGVRFWNFIDRVTIGPAGGSDTARRTGART